MITLTDIHKTFDGKPILRGVNLTLPQGQSTVVIGASGSGKSVLMRSILGLVTPDSGTITHQNAPLDHKAFLNDFGMLFQGAALFDSLPIWQNVAFRLLRQMPKARARAIALQKLARVGLDADVADRLPATLSGGMQKRAGLARAIATDPSVIFFDEPTTGLDPIMARTINTLIRDIVSETSATTLTITHDMTTVHSIADQVALLDNGKIRWHGTPAQMATAQDDQLKAFLFSGS
jgi:phospholipid/cholesterol/gamma-HCH transport system ATP-binding protein